MPVRRAVAIALVFACAPSLAAQSQTNANGATVSAAQSVYIWKVETPLVAAAETRQWRIQGTAGPAADAVKNALTRFGGAAGELAGGNWAMPMNRTLKGTPIAAGFVPWTLVPEKGGDVCLLEKGTIPFGDQFAAAPWRFVANPDGAWADSRDGDVVLFAPFVYPSADGAGLILEGPFVRVAGAKVNVMITGKPAPAIVVGTVRYPDDRWSPVGKGYAIKGGGLQFDATGVWLMVGTEFIRVVAVDAKGRTATDAGADLKKAALPEADKPALEPVAMKAMTDIFAKIDKGTLAGQVAGLAALAKYAGANVNTSNAATITRAMTVAVSVLIGPPTASETDGLVMTDGISDKRGKTIGETWIEKCDGRALYACQLRVENELATAYQIDRGRIVTVTLAAVENPRGTAAVRAGIYPDGTVYEVAVPGEDDPAIRELLIQHAIKLARFERKSWVASKRGGELAEIFDAPEGGHCVVDATRPFHSGGTVTWFGARFTPAVSREVKAYRDKNNNVIQQNATAHTYEGLDGRYYTIALGPHRETFMLGVWLDEAKRIADDFMDPAAFKVTYSLTRSAPRR
jgi:hypothetical protein